MTQVGITQILEGELVSAPTPHSLATGKNVVVFNLKISDKLLQLQPGDIVGFQNEFYEVMNHFMVQSRTNYLKFYFVPKSFQERA
jgi:hypothetical protein